MAAAQRFYNRIDILQGFKFGDLFCDLISRLLILFGAEIKNLPNFLLNAFRLDIVQLVIGLLNAAAAFGLIDALLH